jgi:hypothetical protein
VPYSPLGHGFLTGQLRSPADTPHGRTGAGTTAGVCWPRTADSALAQIVAGDLTAPPTLVEAVDGAMR